MNVGIIGLGSMGSMLVKGLLKSEVIQPAQLFVYNRTVSKTELLAEQYPFVVCQELADVCKASDILFLCTKPLDIYPLLLQVKPFTKPETHIVSVAAGVSLAHLAGIYEGPVSKVIPTVTSQELHGVSLFASHERVALVQKDQLVQLLQAIGKAFEITESAIETTTILTSSAPGLIAGMMEQFAQAASRKTPELSLDTYRSLLVETLLGTALLLNAEKMDFDEMIERVATKGGITEEGLSVLGKALPQAFNELLDMTEQKHGLLKNRVDEQFS